MAKTIRSRLTRIIPLILTILIIGLRVNDLNAQTTDENNSEHLKPLRSGVGILAFTGDLRWRTFFIPSSGGLREDSQTELQAEFRNIRMLSSKFGLGYRAFSTVLISGFFDGVGLGGVALGPLARFYPLETTRWQPYLQGNLLAGYNLALSDAIGINDVGGVRYRSGLRGGLSYKFSNAFGVFWEVGPAWEYNASFQLDSRAIQFNIGIELFRF